MKSSQNIIHFAKKVPLFIITGILMLSYYAYVLEFCLDSLKSNDYLIVVLNMYHILLFMVLWTFWKLVRFNHTSLPMDFKLPLSKYYQLSIDDDIKTPTNVRYCFECEVIRPPRSHHCSVCQKCILKKDHHCLYINNCVSFGNYKYFILFLAYTSIYCIYISTQYFYAYWSGYFKPKHGKYYVIALLILAILCAFGLVTTLLFHGYLLLNNKTSIEFVSDRRFDLCPRKGGYNLGKVMNFKQVFGDEPKFWFIPVASSKGNGLVFPERSVECFRLA